ncbi:MAG TPA: glycosyl hydrolase [Verrucomicrobiae bacterium]|nr:glycosyl hydrolase [Verrucomicrobiae bacterium]
MPIHLDLQRTPRSLLPKLHRLFALSADKILALDKAWNPARGAPVFTRNGKYASRGWTEWTQGFQAGSPLLQFDATAEARFLELGRSQTLRRMAPHLTHFGAHDHGFNIISTYGNLWRLMREGKIPFNQHELNFYELALKISGAVQAARWTRTADGAGFIYSFNGPHSLFVDSIRSLRSLALAHCLGHFLLAEHDQRVSLLDRLASHALLITRYNIYYGQGRDIYDVPGRVAHESLFNTIDGSYRCPGAQQGFSPFSTWTRGLAWALLGCAELLEFLAARKPRAVAGLKAALVRAGRVTADFYIAGSFADGLPPWDTAAPNLDRLDLSKPADPFNAWEPVDSSAAAIAAQGLFRLAHYLDPSGKTPDAARYRSAALTAANTLFDEPYLSTSPRHQGLVLHSVYHRPNGWDTIARGQKIPNGESSMWGDYHARELGLLLLREANSEKYLAFFA